MFADSVYLSKQGFQLRVLTALPALLLIVLLVPHQIVGQQPDERDKEIWRGALLIELGHLADAVYWLEQTVERYPSSDASHSTLGIAYLAAGDTAAAITAFERAVELAPDDARHRRNLGNTYTDAKRYNDAITQHLKAIELDPASAGHHVDLGVAFAWQRQLDSAIAHMEEALSLDPNHPVALMNLSLYHGQREEWMEAFVLQIHMADVDEWYPQHTEMAGAVADQIRQTVEHDAKARPDDPMAHYYAAYADNFKSDYGGALDDIEKAIELDNTVAEFHKAQGLFHSHRRKHKDARKALEHCIEIDPEYWQCHAWLGYTYNALSEPDKAREAMEAAVALAPDVINLRRQLGVAYSDEQPEAAAGELERAIALGDRHPLTRFNLAVNHYNAGNHQLAWVHATIARNMGWGDAAGLVDLLEKELDGEPECYARAGLVFCIRQ